MLILFIDLMLIPKPAIVLDIFLLNLDLAKLGHITLLITKATITPTVTTNLIQFIRLAKIPSVALLYAKTYISSSLVVSISILFLLLSMITSNATTLTKATFVYLVA